PLAQLSYSSLSHSHYLPDLHSSPTRRSSDLELLGPGELALGGGDGVHGLALLADGPGQCRPCACGLTLRGVEQLRGQGEVVGDGDRKSTRLNSSHVSKSYAVLCLKQKKRLTS